MTPTLITDQPEILRVMLEQGVEGRIRPTDDTFGGAVGLFPDIHDRSKWYIIDLCDGEYIMIVMDHCTPTEALTALRSFIDKCMGGKVSNGRFSVIEKPKPDKN